MSWKPMIGLFVATFALASLAGCDRGTGGSTAAVSTQESTATTEVTTTSSNSAPVDPTSISVAPTAPKKFLVSTATSHTGDKDQVKFTFNDGVPGYAMSYITPPITDEGAGNAVAISGSNVLKVVFESSATTDLTGGLKNYYTGAPRITPTDTTVVSEVVKVSEYEGRLLWGIGTKAKAPFTIDSAGNTLTITFG